MEREPIVQVQPVQDSPPGHRPSQGHTRNPRTQQEGLDDLRSHFELVWETKATQCAETFLRRQLVEMNEPLLMCDPNPVPLDLLHLMAATTDTGESIGPLGMLQDEPLDLLQVVHQDNHRQALVAAELDHIWVPSSAPSSPGGGDATRCPPSSTG